MAASFPYKVKAANADINAKVEDVDLCTVVEELQQKDKSSMAQLIKDLTSRLNTLTQQNNEYHLRISACSCQDTVAPPTPSSASTSSPWSPSFRPITRPPTTPWSPPMAPLSRGSPSSPQSGRSSTPVPLMSLRFEHMHDEALPTQNHCNSKLEEEDVKHKTEEVVDRLNSWEDEYTNVSTIVPYTAVSSTTSLPAPARKKDAKQNSWISKLVRTVDKLARKYAIPVEKRRSKAYKTSPIIPKVFSSLYTHLAAPEPEPVTVPEPYPTIVWDKVRFKPSLPSPKPYPVYGCSPDPVFYEGEKKQHPYDPTPIVKFKCQDPFGNLPGYLTSEGVVDVPATPVGGYVYRPGAGWVIYATSPSTERGKARGQGCSSHSSASGG